MLRADCYLLTEYVAGFFDGEGSIGVYKNGKGAYFLRTQVTQNINMHSTRILTELRDRFGGNLSIMRFRQNKAYNWQLNGHGAAKFLATILPFLIIKERQALIAIEWQSHRPIKAPRGADGRILPAPKPTQHDYDVERTLKELKRERG